MNKSIFVVHQKVFEIFEKNIIAILFSIIVQVDGLSEYSKIAATFQQYF